MITPEEARHNANIYCKVNSEIILDQIEYQIKEKSKRGECETMYPVENKTVRKMVVKNLIKHGYKAKEICEKRLGLYVDTIYYVWVRW